MNVAPVCYTPSLKEQIKCLQCLRMPRSPGPIFEKRCFHCLCVQSVGGNANVLQMNRRFLIGHISNLLYIKC